MLHLVAKTYGKRPSEFLGIPWEEYQFDVAVLMASMEDGEPGDAPANNVPQSWDWSDVAG